MSCGEDEDVGNDMLGIRRQVIAWGGPTRRHVTYIETTLVEIPSSIILFVAVFFSLSSSFPPSIFSSPLQRRPKTRAQSQIYRLYSDDDLSISLALEPLCTRRHFAVTSLLRSFNIYLLFHDLIFLLNYLFIFIF